jgi:hypothetical protein
MVRVFLAATFQQTSSQMLIYRWSLSSPPSSYANSDVIYKQDIQRPYNKVGSLFCFLLQAVQPVSPSAPKYELRLVVTFLWKYLIE